MTALRKKVVKALPWSVAESVANGLIGIGQTFVITWFLVPADMGRAAIALSIAALVEVVAQLGMVEALIAVPSADTEMSDTAFTATMASTTAAALLCMAVSVPMAMLFGDQALAAMICLAALSLPINALVVVPTALLTRKMRAARMMIRFSSGRLAVLLLIGGLALAGFGAWAIIGGTVLGGVVTALIVYPTLTRWPRFRFSRDRFRELLRFGGALSFERLLWTSVTRIFWLIIGFIHGPAVLGYFQFAQRLIDEAANLVQNFAIRFGLSFFSAMRRSNRNPRDAFMTASRIVAAVATPIFIGLALILPYLIGTIFAARWAPGVIISQITALGWVIGFPRVLTGPLLRAQGEMKVVVLYAVCAFAITIIGGALTGGQSLAVIGIAWVARQIYGLPWSIWAIRRYLSVGIRQQLQALTPPIFAGAVMAAAVLGVQHMAHGLSKWAILAVSIAAGLVYPLALAIVDRKTVTMLVNLRKRSATVAA